MGALRILSATSRCASCSKSLCSSTTSGDMTAILWCNRSRRIHCARSTSSGRRWRSISRCHEASTSCSRIPSSFSHPPSNNCEAIFSRAGKICSCSCRRSSRQDPTYSKGYLATASIHTTTWIVLHASKRRSSGQRKHSSLAFATLVSATMTTVTRSAFGLLQAAPVLETIMPSTGRLCSHCLFHYFA